MKINYGNQDISKPVVTPHSRQLDRQKPKLICDTEAITYFNNFFHIFLFYKMRPTGFKILKCGNLKISIFPKRLERLNLVDENQSSSVSETAILFRSNT